MKVVWVRLVLFTLWNRSHTVQGEDEECEITIHVRRHTAYEASAGQTLRMNCPVKFCQDPPPPVRWYKLDNKSVPLNVSRISPMETEWRMERHLEGVSVLVFHRVLSSDSGLYQCKIGNVVGHLISVSVTGVAEELNDTSQTETNDTSSSTPAWNGLWTYVYCAAGIMGMVVIVITVSVVSMRGCKGKPKTEAQTENQYMVIPMVEQPYPPTDRQPSPRESPPSGPPPRTKTPPPPAQRQNDHVYGKVENDRQRQRGRTEEGAGSVVYAALNHQAGAGPGPWPRRAAEETSEYASIRVS